MEVWDAYKHDGSFAGCDLIRGETISDGLFHLVCEVLVKHKDGSYLLMQRDYEKESDPGMFEATAGGSALKGESPVSAAIRELREETGIIAGKLTQIGGRISYNRHALLYQFLCVTDCDKAAIALQQGETISYKWVSKDEFLKFMDSDECIPEQKNRLAAYLNSIR